MEKLREDGNRHAKRVALKNARIRPKDYQAGLDKSAAEAAALLAASAAVEEEKEKETPTGQDLPLNTTTESTDTANTTDQSTLSTSETSDAKPIPGWVAQSAVRTTATQPSTAPVMKGRMREDRIPSLNVARSCGDLDFKMDPLHKIISCEPDVTFIRISDQPYVDHTILLNGPHKEKRRHFLFMSTDGTFDYMYEETAERQNRAIAKAIGPMIEDGEKIGKYLLEEEEKIKGQTIEHGKTEVKEEKDVKKETNEMELDTKNVVEDKVKNDDVSPMEVDNEQPKAEQEETKEDLPRVPLLHRELTEEENKARKVKERTLVSTARYFANREGAHGFFASTLQDYDDCTIILVEI